MQNLFKEGEVVVERIRPGQLLIVARHAMQIYYCKIQENIKRKELVYSESELMLPALETENQSYYLNSNSNTLNNEKRIKI